MAPMYPNELWPHAFVCRCDGLFCFCLNFHCSMGDHVADAGDGVE